jgi:hypothetical protein
LGNKPQHSAFVRGAAGNVIAGQAVGLRKDLNASVRVDSANASTRPGVQIVKAVFRQADHLVAGKSVSRRQVNKHWRVR